MTTRSNRPPTNNEDDYMVYRYKPGEDRVGHCHICGQKLDRSGAPCTLDCGGDCLLCMADAGDPQCIEALNRAPTKVEQQMILEGLPDANPRDMLHPAKWADMLRQSIINQKRQGKLPEVPAPHPDDRGSRIPGLNWSRPLARFGRLQ